MLLILLTTVATLIVAPYFHDRVSMEMLWLRLLIVALVTMIAFFATDNVWHTVRNPHIPLLAAQLLAVVIGAFIGTIASGLVIGRSLTQMFTVEPILLGILVFTTVGIGIGAVTAMVLVYRESAARADARMAQVALQQQALEKQVLEARLKLMQAQIEPHFLFNTLANVQHLVEANPPLANKVLGDLITYLRAALPEMRGGGTFLGREADLVRAYLAIQAVRMGARLKFEVNVPPELRAVAFPPMMLMTLVENAIKHGVDPLQEGGQIRVHAMRDADNIVVTVSDSGMGITEQGHAGVGLVNVRERLSALYGSAATLNLTENVPRGVSAALRVPLNQG